MSNVLDLPTLHQGLPARVKTHVSGGRDQWSAPRETAPTDHEAAVFECLGEVLDPEIPISLVDLGLIYGVRYDTGTVEIDLTFTATACPCMEFIREDIADRLLAEFWIDSVELNEVWEPAWTRDRITQRGRDQLKTLGVGT